MPGKKKTLEVVSAQSNDSGGREQILLVRCSAEARVEGVLSSQPQASMLCTVAEPGDSRRVCLLFAPLDTI